MQQSKSDSSTHKLLQCLQQQLLTCSHKNILIIADENCLNAISSLSLSKHTVTLISNRYNIASQAQTINPDINSHFNDFDFASDFDNQHKHHYDYIVYRLSKEKAIAHHIFNWTHKMLAPGGQLTIAGQKSDGIKGYCDRLRKQLGYNGELNKDKDDYIARLAPSSTHTNTQLDDKNYTQLREIANTDFSRAGDNDSYRIYSKPGVFGWNKIDDGSAFLAATLLHHQQTGKMPTAFPQALDIGCGYGYLTLLAHRLGAQSITATDNNAAALNAIKLTLTANAMSGHVIAADSADNLTGEFSLILCNPPFHQGFDTEKSLTEKFVAAAKRLLAKNGYAYFVTNAFVGIEKYANTHFSRVEQIANNRKFKVLALRT